MLDEEHVTQHTSKPPESKDEDTRIGVYTCYCGGNISDVVNCERVAHELGKFPGVTVSRTHMAMCSDAGQALIESDIRDQGVNRVVIGACAPSLHEGTFRGVVARAGLNPYLYYHVGIREQDSWVHGNDHDGATRKAIQMMKAGVAKARLLEPLDAIRLTAEQHALVIGGGIAGLRAAMDLARRNIQVTLIEKTPFLGGRVAQLESVFPCANNVRKTLHELIEQVLAHSKITVLTRAQLIGASGYVGDFHLQIRQESRGVQNNFIHADSAIAACPVEVPDEYNYGLTNRKAFYLAYPGCYPAAPAIDWEHCTKCGKCKEIDASSIDLDAKQDVIEIKAGAIVVASGFNLYEPRSGEYGYGELPEVISLAKFIRLLALTRDGEELRWNERRVRNIVLIHCVGSRQIEGIHEPQPDGQVNPYCSRVCCTATLHMADEILKRYPDIQMFDLYQDIRTYGRGHETYYQQSLDNGVRFLRYHQDEGPEISRASDGDTYPVLVKVKDYLTWGEELEVPADLVVLATGMVPRAVEELIRLLKISPGTDRFLLEVHPKLRPVETAVPGIVLAGTAQGPMTIMESTAAASAAAAKVSALLGKGHVELEPYVARVDLNKCNGAGACLAACGYEDAITLTDIHLNGKVVRRAVVTPANCAGCGACVSACPNGAIDVQGWTLSQYEAMVEALVAELPELEVA